MESAGTGRYRIMAAVIMIAALTMGALQLLGLVRF